MNPFMRILIAAICVSMSLSCSYNVFQTSDTGGGSEITNGASAYIRLSDGTPVNNAQVFVRPQRFLRDTSLPDSSRIPDAYTDETGYFKIDSLEPGTYFIEVNDKRHHAIRMAFTVDSSTKPPKVTDLGIDTLRPTGILRGSITQAPASLSAETFVQIYGMDRIAKVNPATRSFLFDMLPPGNFSLHVQSSLPLQVPSVDVDSVIVGEADTTTIPVPVWKSSMNLFFNTTATGAQVAGAVVNFPVLVRLTNSNFAFSGAKKNGEDVRFAKSSGIPVPFEIERWDSANGSAEVWVRVDTIYGNDQSRFVTMFWGNADAGSGSNSAAVFDTGNGFQGVWHLDDTGPVARDATVNHFDGTLNNMPAASRIEGAIGSAYAFDGISSFIEMAGTASGKLDFPENGTYLVSAWVYADTLDGIHDEIASKGWHQYFLELGSNNTWEFNVLKGGVGWENSRSPATGKVWSHVVGIRSDTSQYLFVNGTCVDSMVKIGNPTTSLRSSSDNFKIGTHTGATDPFTWFFKGKIDEVRVLNIAPKADWVKLCYMNQKANDALVIFK
jgi:hypothetical protein